MVPRALRVVALIHWAGGVLAAAGIVVNLFHDRLFLDLDLLGIPIYYGLLRLSSGWRTCALVFLWGDLIATPLMFLVGLVGKPPAFVLVLGVRLESISPVWMSVLAVPAFILALWQYRVLTRPEIRSLFTSAARAEASR